MASLQLGAAKWVVSTIPVHLPGVSQEDSRRTILQAVRATGFAARVAVASRVDEDADRLLAAGADLVLEPFQDAADRAVDLLVGARPGVDGKDELPR